MAEFVSGINMLGGCDMPGGPDDAKRLVLSTYLFWLMGFSGICITLEQVT